MMEASRAFLLFVVSTFHHFLSHADTAPHYSFVEESTSAPPISFYDYIIIGGGTAGCPLAATLSETAKILVLERGGSPYVNRGQTDKANLLLPLLDPSPDSIAQLFVSEDGVYNHRARVLGGCSVFNAGFYSHAETAFVKEAGLDEGLVDDSYRWVENKLVYKPIVLQWQSAVRDGLLEAGVVPYNGFTYDHIIGTKIGATIFDEDGHRHSAADLLDYADPTNIKVYLHATVLQLLFTTKEGKSGPRAEGVIFRDALGVRHKALLRNESKSEIILSAGAIGSPQLLMLSGIGPANQLEALGINVVMDQPMVGQGMADNPLNGLIIPSPQPVELSLISLVGITQFGNYIEAGSGLNLAPTWVQWLLDNLATFLKQSTAWSNIGDLFNTQLKGGIIIDKVNGPNSRGYLELHSTNPDDNPKVTFNYFQDPEDLSKCVKGMETLINVVDSEAFSKFRYQTLSTQDLLDFVAVLPFNLRPRHLNTATSLEQYCIDTVMTLWHYHGGCQVGKVVDRDYKVLGVDGLRVIDASTFDFSPGTNPQATIMMLGRYMGVRIQQDRHSSRQ